jgi:hypothetical protein
LDITFCTKEAIVCCGVAVLVLLPLLLALPLLELLLLELLLVVAVLPLVLPAEPLIVLLLALLPSDARLEDEPLKPAMALEAPVAPLELICW